MAPTTKEKRGANARPEATTPAPASASATATTRDTPFVEVRELMGEELSDLRLEVLSGEQHLDNRIVNPRVQKPGLAFAGYVPYIKPGRAQIVGESETAYLRTLSAAKREDRFERITQQPIPVFILTKGLEPLPDFLAKLRQREIPLLRSPELSSLVIKRVSWFLEDHLVPTSHVHGVLLDVYGLGVLLIGRSGVGKSESALDLITRGHSLVADDRVTVKRYPSGDVVGFSEAPLHHHMELRGLGIVNIKDLFGLASVRERKTVDLVIELEQWDPEQVYDRLGLEETVYHVLGTPLPYIRMPVAMGRNLSILVEIAARNHVLKMQGHFSAHEFARKLEEQLERKRRGAGGGK